MSLLERLKQQVTETHLYYVDQWDHLEAEMFQKVIVHGHYDELYEHWEPQVQCIIDEHFTQEEQIEEGDILPLYDYLMEVDQSTPLDDLLRNTRDKHQLYSDVNFHVEEEGIEGVKEMMREFGLKRKDNESAMDELTSWNFYWGTVGILFKPDAQELIEALSDKRDWEYKITFTDPMIAIMDKTQWSWGYARFKWKITLSLNVECIIVDACSFGYAITDVYWNDDLWDSEFIIEKWRANKIVKVDPEISKYAKWDSQLKMGICDADDPRFDSHETEYRNAYPAWWTCKKCGRFFID